MEFDEKIAAGFGAAVEAAAFEAELAAGLRAGGDLQTHGAVRRGDFEFAAEDGAGDGEFEFVDSFIFGSR